MLENYLNNLQDEMKNITEDRKIVLKKISDFISEKKKKNRIANLIFICTHNSRRSHFSQILAQAIAKYFNIDNVFCYSGGTEATAIYPSVINSLQNIGISFNALNTEKNSIFSIKYDKNSHPIIGFSKCYNSHFNPQSEFAAIMTCNQADTNCPFIPNAEARFSLPFDDPKEYDNTKEEEKKYKERCKDIAIELLYLFSSIKD